MHVHLDAVGGIAGDMFLAAGLDAWPELADGVRDVMRQAGLPPDWGIEIVAGHSKSMAGTRVAITPPAPARGHDHHDGDDHGHAHATGRYRDICARLRESPIEAPVRDRALDIFERLASAEAVAHGVAIDDVHFHEIADWDSVADIVGAAWLIDHLEATWSVSPLPTGSGMVRTQHGALPVPAPAVARLLAGFPVVDDGIGGERVTPTGAAIVAHLQPRIGGPGTGTIGVTGHGLGTRELDDRPNLLRLITLEPARSTAASGPWLDGTVSVVEFDVDDQSPEDLAVGLDTIRATSGVIDVVQTAMMGKKGRLGTQVRILCRPDERDAVIAACFAQTTTIGLRWRDDHRAELRRHAVTRDGVEGKAAVRPGGAVTAKPESDAIAETGDTFARRHRSRSRFDLAEDER